MPFAKIPSGYGYYAISGTDLSTPPLVLIHGAGGSHLDWPPALRGWVSRRTYAVDLPGHGRSPLPARQSVAEYSAWLSGLLSELEAPPLILVGHSMGSAIALDLALDAPGLVSGLVLIGAGTRLPVAPAILDRIVAARDETVIRIVDWAYGVDVPEEIKRLGRQRMAQVDTEVLHGDFVACNEFDLTDRLGEIDSPALIISGSEDRMTPANGAAQLHQLLPRSELTLIDGAGHMVTFERTNEVVEIIARFLDRLQP